MAHFAYDAEFIPKNVLAKDMKLQIIFSECHFFPYVDSTHIWNLVTHRRIDSKSFFPNAEIVTDNLVVKNASFSKLQRITN